MMHFSPHLAYIGPGAGFVFLESFFTLVVSILAGLLSIVLWPFRMLLRMVRRRSAFGGARVRKLIFLGLDGLDPSLTEKFMAEGKLPNLARLREQGSYRRLRTTFPALSPVAWSTFATGVHPAKHNIFDFLNRDLRSYVPELSSSRVRPSQRILRLGKYRIPLSPPLLELRRRSKPFWEILGSQWIRSTILRVPITFPPQRFRGLLLSAMCTPDVRGTQGTFSWFTSGGSKGACTGGNRYPLSAREDGFEGAVTGPDNSLVEGAGPMQIPFRIHRAGESGYALEIQGETYQLRAGEYTPWVRLRFHALAGTSVHGIARFLLTDAGQEPSLYVTPIQIDPEAPALPISEPRYYATYLSKLQGTFATLGMAEDTWALNEGAIDEEAFLTQARLIQQEREAMFLNALERTRRGVVACVFDTTDRVQHMFYRYLDPARAGSRYAGVIEQLYRDMDRLVAKTLDHVDPDTALFVLSDHGFCSFRRGVNLNAWLHQNGYLALEEDAAEGGEAFAGVDWSRTSAYTFGFGGIYLNLRGREARGSVGAEDADRLKDELVARLASLPDEATGGIAIRRICRSSEVYQGPYLEAAPDLLVGYADGYRASWDAAVGRVTAGVFEDNTKAWSGDHCVDPALVPGVLFSNRKMDAEDPGIEDLAPTALSLFGIQPPGWMDGRPVIRLA